MVEIDEPVAVVASFYKGRVRPLKFKWNERVIPVKEVTYQWVQRDGLRRWYLFSVTDGKTLYNLSYEPQGQQWKLRAVETEGGI